MENQPPLLLYFIITVAIVGALVYGGIYLLELFGPEPGTESVSEEEQERLEDLKLAYSMWGVAAIILIILLMTWLSMRILKKGRSI